MFPEKNTKKKRRRKAGSESDGVAVFPLLLAPDSRAVWPRRFPHARVEQWPPVRAVVHLQRVHVVLYVKEPAGVALVHNLVERRGEVSKKLIPRRKASRTEAFASSSETMPKTLPRGDAPKPTQLSFSPMFPNYWSSSLDIGFWVIRAFGKWENCWRWSELWHWLWVWVWIWFKELCCFFFFFF